MRLLSLFIACLLLSGLGISAPAMAQDDTSAARRAEIARRYGLDPTSPLESRVRETSADVLKLFEGDKQPLPTPHTLTEKERRKLSAAFAALPPLHRKILSERLRSISFLDGMPNTGLTLTIDTGDSYRLFDITIRAAVLHQTASEWLTEKERTMFDATGSPLSVSVEAGKRDALVFVLLHEATHIMDSCLGLTSTQPSGNQPAGEVFPGAFSKGVWTDRLTPVPEYHDPLRERIRFRPGGRALPIEKAEVVYASLRQTPFVSLYGSSNWFDDLAEYAAVYHWTQVLKQPYRIVLRNTRKVIFSYEPMKSDLVRRRMGLMKQFYETSPPNGTAS